MDFSIANIRALALLFIIVLIVSIVAALFPRLSDTQNISVAPPLNTVALNGVETPCSPTLTSTFPVKILPYSHFTIGYDEQAKSPAWVMYYLNGPIRFRGDQRRPSIFTTEFRTSAHVAYGDYRNTDFDRGHLCPAYAMFSRYGEAAQKETFIMANVVPQRRGLNAGEWEELEAAIAGRDGRGDGWAGEDGGVWVINGPVYARRPASHALPNGTWIPDSCWSVIIRKIAGKWQSFGFLMPNERQVDGPYQRYAVSIEHVQRVSGVRLQLSGCGE